MKKRLLVLTVALISAGFLFAASYKKGAVVYVNVKSSQLKNGTGIFSKTVAKVSYGDAFTVVQGDSKKTQVKSSSNVIGWIATGSLTTKKIVAEGKGNTATKSELALAGKGFSAEAEKAFKSSDSSLNYSQVDLVEKINVSDQDLYSFIVEGKLAGGEQ